jgi:putative NADH-flavin reductase
MRLAIFGGTGGTGLALCRLALERGHSLRVLLRNPNRMTLSHPQMRIVLGNVLEREAVTKTLLGSDAVLSCLGTRNLMRNDGVVSTGTHLVMELMREMGLRRFVVESAFGAGESLAQATLLQRAVFATLLRHPYADKNVMEPDVKASGLEWTILRPTRLSDGEATGRYVAGPEPPASGVVTRADVAAAMLRAVEERLWIREALTVTGA